MNNVIPELIKIVQVKILKSVVTTTTEYLEKPIKPGNVRVSISQNSAFNFELKNVRIRLEIRLDGVDNQDKLIGIQGDFGLEYHFHVDNLEAFTEEVEGIKKVSSSLGTTLISIAYSTARGIVIERTQGTFLNGIILPVIDPKEVLREGKEEEPRGKSV